MSVKASKINAFTLIFLLTFICLLNIIPKIDAQEVPLKDAYFTNSFSDFKIYDEGTVEFSFAILNEKSSEESFIVYIFRNNFRVYKEEIACQKGKSSDVIDVLITENWMGPNVYDMKVELRTYSGVLQDSHRFSVKVVKLFIFDWFYSMPEIVAHSIRNETLLIAFENGGNDLMYNAVIEVEENPQIEVEPKSTNLGNISAREIISTEISVRSLKTTEPGNYTLIFEINYGDFEGEVHTEEKNVSFIVIKQSTKIILDYSSNVKYDQKIILYAKLLNDNENYIENQFITFSLNNEEIGKVETNSSGDVSLEYYPTNLDVGEYEIKATFSGSESLNSSYAMGSLIIIPLGTFLEISMQNPALAKENASFEISLKDENGKAISDRLVMLYLDEMNAKNLTTDMNGKAVTNYIFNKSGNIYVKAVYNGDDNYLNSQSELKTLRVDPMPTILYLDIESVITTENPVDFKVKLEDKQGNGIESANINLFINDEKFTTSITNENGYATFNNQFTNARIINSISINAEFDGNDAYSPSQIKRSVTILNLSIFIVLIVIIIAGATLALILFIKLNKGGFNLLAKIPSKASGLNICINCGAKISSSDKFCPFCGSKKGAKPSITPTLDEVDEKVYNYLVKSGGTISPEKASKELNIPLEKLEKSLGNLKKAGRIAKTDIKK
ncbi:zinc-ribbon domain-containing protein [[Eubacterium] cellulosolvens]